MIAELKNPTRNLPLAIIFSMSIVITIYLMTLISYFAVLPLELIKSSISGTWFGYKTMGFAGKYISNRISKIFWSNLTHTLLYLLGAILIPLMVTCSTIGAANSNLIGNSRLIAASSDEGILFPKFFSRIHAKTTTPINAIILTCIVSCVYCIPQDIGMLFVISSFTQCIFTLLTVVGLLMMRRSHPHMSRPFKVFTPLAWIFCLVTMGLIVFPFIGMSTVEAAMPFILSFVVMALPIPLIFYRVKKTRSD